MRVDQSAASRIVRNTFAANQATLRRQAESAARAKLTALGVGLPKEAAAVAVAPRTLEDVAREGDAGRDIAAEGAAGAQAAQHDPYSFSDDEVPMTAAAPFQGAVSSSRQQRRSASPRNAPAEQLDLHALSKGKASTTPAVATASLVHRRRPRSKEAGACRSSEASTPPPYHPLGRITPLMRDEPRTPDLPGCPEDEASTVSSDSGSAPLNSAATASFVRPGRRI